MSHVDSDVVADITINAYNKRTSFSITKDELVNKTIIELLMEHSMSDIDNTPTLKETTPESTDLKIPKWSEIEEYIILKKSGFLVEDVFQHFFDDRLESCNEKEATRIKNAVRAKITRVRDAIEESEGGEWISEQRGRGRFYKFVIKNESLQNTLDTNEEQAGAESY